MTVERARQILGEDIESLVDKEVEMLIQSAGNFCDVMLDVIQKDLLTKQKIGEHNGSKH